MSKFVRTVILNSSVDSSPDMPEKHCTSHEVQKKRNVGLHAYNTKEGIQRKYVTVKLCHDTSNKICGRPTATSTVTVLRGTKLG